MAAEHLTDIMVALDAAIKEQSEATARGAYTELSDFARQQGKIFGLEMARDIAYRVLCDITGEEQ